MEMLWPLMVGFVFILIAIGLPALAAISVLFDLKAGEPIDREPEPQDNTFRDIFVCMDCGLTAGRMLWVRDEDGNVRYGQSKTSKCPHCYFEMTCVQGEIAPEY